MGIPHTEVQFILANGRTAQWGDQLAPDSYVSVYPHFHIVALDSDQVLHVDPEDQSRFVLDAHLGRLAKFLRMLGLDVLYKNDYQDQEIAAISSSTDRIVLTRDRKLLMRNEIRHGYYVRKTAPEEQVSEIVHRYQVHEHIQPLTRCLECNSVLVPLARQQAEAKLPDSIRRRYDDFSGCEVCGRVYWKGSHYDRMLERISRMKETSN